MCGRFSRTSSRDVLAAEFGVAQFINVDLSPRYNIASSQYVEAIIHARSEKRRVEQGEEGAGGALLR